MPRCRHYSDTHGSYRGHCIISVLVLRHAAKRARLNLSIFRHETRPDMTYVVDGAL